MEGTLWVVETSTKKNCMDIKTSKEKLNILRLEEKKHKNYKYSTYNQF